MLPTYFSNIPAGVTMTKAENAKAKIWTPLTIFRGNSTENKVWKKVTLIGKIRYNDRYSVLITICQFKLLMNLVRIYS
jgi:hypothetical protein